jgi:hypothetical protein
LLSFGFAGSAYAVPVNASESDNKKSAKKVLMDLLASVIKFPFLFVPTQAITGRQYKLFVKTGNISGSTLSNKEKP